MDKVSMAFTVDDNVVFISSRSIVSPTCI